MDHLSGQEIRKDIDTANADEEARLQESSQMQKYESPKFFVGSGSPVGGSKRKLSNEQEEKKLNSRSSAPN